MILLIDNYDSFSYNLYQLVGKINPDIKVIRNDEYTCQEIEAMNSEKIIISPGPGRPSDAGICEEAISYFAGKVPILGVCLGHQAICETYGATITYAKKLMHGKMSVANVDINCKLFKGLQKRIEVARYHSLAASEENFPDVLTVIARTDDDEIMAVKHKDYEIYGVQFHPEVFHSEDGTRLLKNFVVDICGGKQDWSASSFVDTTVAALKEQVGNDRVILGLSGGVDSSVAAVLLHRAIGKNLTCIFVDHGLLRKNEFKNVMHDYECLGLNVIGVDASDKFFKDLEGVTDPEQKRKIIGRDFVEVFNADFFKLLFIFRVVNFLENILKAVVVGLRNRVFCRKPQVLLHAQRVIKAGACKALNALINIM